ncbi:MAG: nucleotide exchange factor GrpE [Lewinellaceae bacterium]|nr:nucleotide exchange factor GrpE [Lewinellaceae bacterium]
MSEKDTHTSEQELQDQEMAAQEGNDTGSEEHHDASTAALDTLKKQLEEAKNKYLYLLSDFENYKRNAARDRTDLIQTAGRDIMTSLLDVLDDFDRAVKNNAMPDGIGLIHQKMVNILQSKGLKGIGTKAGDAFDADVQEAVAEIPVPEEDAKGKIVDVLEPGYMLGDKIIRYAKSSCRK